MDLPKKNSFSSPIFPPVEKPATGEKARPHILTKTRPRMDLKGLINYIESHSATPLNNKTKIQRLKSNDSPGDYFLDAGRTPVMNKSQFSETKNMTLHNSFKLHHQHSPGDSEGFHLREKRLQNAQMYQTFVNKSPDRSPSHKTNLLPSPAKTLKGFFSRDLSSQSLIHHRQLNSSVQNKSPLLQQEASSAQLMDHSYSDQFSGMLKKPKNGLLMNLSQSFSRAEKSKNNPKVKEEWKEYSQKVSEQLSESKAVSLKKLKVHRSISLNQSENETNDEYLQRMKPTYSQFIKKNFEDHIVERLDTFGAFAFNTIEMEENREIPVFFNETKHYKDALGSMGVVDLWSKKQRCDLAKRANFANEKKKVEKFSFYRVKDKKTDYNKRPKFIVLHRRNENIFKDILARAEFTEYVKKNKHLALMSSLQRHMGLQGKTFYKPRESALDFQNLLKANEWSEGLEILLQSLEKFSEENKGDYARVLEYSASKKKSLLREAVKDNDILLKKLQTYLSS